MGYCYERGTGRLVCDGCGKATAAVRKRPCVYKVSDRGIRGGEPRELPYCPAPALCGECLGAYGGIHGVHGAECAEGAAASQAYYDEKRARLDAGDGMVICRQSKDDGAIRYVISTYVFADGTERTAMTGDGYRTPDWWNDLQREQTAAMVAMVSG